MKKILIIIFIVIACKFQLIAQHYFQFGIGLGVSYYDSKDLKHFRETYNQVNAPVLLEPMNGFGAAEGLRWEIGYRNINRLGIAVLAGLQSYEGVDFSKFGNGDSRQLEVKMRSMYLEFELGHTFKHFFINGVFNIFFNRKLTLESVYNQPTTPATPKALDGTYGSDRSISSDIGLAVGMVKGPVLLSGKITYPLFTGGSSDNLKDPSQRKITEGTSVFPKDYFDYLDLGDYEGVGSDIDGLKLLVSISFAIKIKR